MKIITKKINNEYKFFLKNDSPETIYPDEVIVMKGKMPFKKNTRAYCDGFNMLSQYIGTVGNMECMGPYSDGGHYKLPQKVGYFTGYNYALFFEKQTTLWGFTSCRRFCGEIRFNSDKYEIAERLYNIPIKSGEIIELESLCILTGEKNNVLNVFAETIQKNHPARKTKTPPSGWCSWYCFGADVTEKDIENNMSAMKENFDFMKYVLIDDGYQKKMGDWLEDSIKFGSMNKICSKIKASGALPAIWAAPFIAEKDSEVLKRHPEYFIHNEKGAPLAADKVSFGGWRCAPWYMLDGTNPAAVKHIKNVFIEMKKRYGWQNNKLWLCDPDCITIANNIKNMVDGGGNTAENEFLSETDFCYCAAYLFASGASILFSGDDMTLYSKKQTETIKKIKNSDNDNICFENDKFEISKNGKYIVILNDSDKEKSFNFNCGTMKDFLDDQDIVNPVKVSAHSGKIIEFSH